MNYRSIQQTAGQFLIVLMLTFMLTSCSSGSGRADNSNASNDPPNIILILADDMGYSDIGCYGGEINTPNLDQLAAEGLRFTQFYNAARCCPTRASLITGLYPHQAGMGAMINDPATTPEGPYQGYLSKNAVTIAEALKQANYYTASSGKWHVGEERPYWPTDRGFDNYYGLISGAANYFDITRAKREGLKRHFVIDSAEYLPPKEGFYMTDAITEHALEFLQKAGTKGQHFFLYLAYTAPHWPLHAKQEDIDKYLGKYLTGWDVLRKERYDRMIKMGLINESWKLSERDDQVTPWKELEHLNFQSVYSISLTMVLQDPGILVRTHFGVRSGHATMPVADAYLFLKELLFRGPSIYLVMWNYI